VATGPFDIANEHTLSATLSYEQALSATSALQGNAAFQRVKPLGSDPKDSLSVNAQLAFTLGKANLGIGLALSRAADATGWSTDLSLSVAVKVL
jgi:hypothetical protein